MNLGKYIVCGSVIFASTFCVRSVMAGSIYGPYVGCSTAAGDDPTMDYNLGGAQAVTEDAGTARDDFLGALNQKYYYEDFQEFTMAKSTLAISSSGLNLTFNPHGLTGTVTGSLTSDDSTDTNSDYADLNLRKGPIGTNTRGTFDAFQSGLNDAYLGEGITDAANQYVDIQNQGKTGSTYSVTIDVSPNAYNAMGLELNDVIQPNKTTVTVTFTGGITETMGALNSNGKAGTLSTNNTWFLGIINPGANITSVTITEQADGDPICLDNVYLGDVISGANGTPLPMSVLGGGGLMGLLALARRRSRIN